MLSVVAGTQVAVTVIPMTNIVTKKMSLPGKRTAIAKSIDNKTRQHQPSQQSRSNKKGLFEDHEEDGDGALNPKPKTP